MADRNLSLILRIVGDAAPLGRAVNQARSQLGRFGAFAKNEFSLIGQAASGLRGQLATLGVSWSALAALSQSARLDKDLQLLRDTAAASASDISRIRDGLFAAATRTGQSVEDLRQGIDTLVAGGQSISQAQATIGPLAETMAVARARADDLARALGVASQQFGFNLSEPGKALELLDKMVVAGRAGYAELENLSNIFARVGGNAKAANMGFEQTLAVVEALSLVEPNAERLATLTDSTLRIFTNAKYRDEAQKATGVSFFDGQGARRDPIRVLEDIQKRYAQLRTDAQRERFISGAFGDADLDTIRGLRELLSSGKLSKLDEIFRNIKGASGTVRRDLDGAIDNAVDQTGRLKNALRKAADDFAKPINDTISQAIKWAMDSKTDGGLGMDGKDMLTAGVSVAAVTALLARYGGKMLGSLAGRATGLATDVAVGKTLEKAAGVTPVYVVNMPGTGLAAGGTGLPELPGKPGPAGSSRAGTILRGVGAALLTFFTSKAAAGAGGLLYSPALGDGTLAGAQEALKGRRRVRWTGKLMPRPASAALAREAASPAAAVNLNGNIRLDIRRDGSITATPSFQDRRINQMISTGRTVPAVAPAGG